MREPLGGEFEQAVRRPQSWSLSPEGWRRVDEALQMVRAAVTDGSQEALHEALTALVMSGPLRVAALPDGNLARPAEPAPRRTIELINRTVHALTDPSDPPDAPGEEP